MWWKQQQFVRSMPGVFPDDVNNAPFSGARRQQD
jgi:hypothetical protein